jgi:ribonuclease Z
MEIPILKGSARISSRLNFVCPQFFPSSGFWPVKTATDLMQQVGSGSPDHIEC